MQVNEPRTLKLREEAIANPASASIAAKGKKKDPMKSAPTVFLTDELPIHGVPPEFQLAEIAKREKTRADKTVKREARKKAEEDRQRMDDEAAPAGLTNGSDSEADRGIQACRQRSR